MRAYGRPPPRTETSIWITTGNGNAARSYAIIKLKAKNLQFLTDWMDPLTGDLDWGSSPTLFEATLNNVKTKMVGANQKDGTFHAFDANHLENGPVWSYQVGTTEDLTSAQPAAPMWDATRRKLYVAGNQTTIIPRSLPVRSAPSTPRLALSFGKGV